MLREGRAQTITHPRARANYPTIPYPVDHPTPDASVEPSADGGPDYDPWVPPVPTSSAKRMAYEMREGVVIVWASETEPPVGGRSADTAAFEPPPPWGK